ncbi:MAG: uncharacterized protein KVP18_003512 [Porospora cf. gigantea A]|uniref:uncharacterized protein n=1 Tax=Porospora cf. gigantea A TaxID=2853593 RepID=UPI00355A815A|nr:MAG: hypothetical protein KVP18_003512 [Porospora cf. gigantea A]
MSPGLLNDSRHSQDLPEEPWYPLLFERLHSTVELGLKTPVAVVFVSTTDEFWALHTEGHPEKCFESLMAGLPPALTGSTLTPGRSFLLLHDEVNSVLSAKEVTEAFNTLSSILPPSACHLLKIGAKNTSLDTDALECIQSFFLSCFPVRPPSLTKLHQLSQSSPKNPMTFTSPLEYPTLNVQDLSPLCDRMGWGELRDIFHLVRRLLKRTVIPTLVRRTEQLDAVSLDKRTFRSQLKGLVSNWGPPHDRTYSESQEAQQAVSMGDLLVWQDNWARAAQVYKAAGNEERQSGPQTGLLFELTAVCLFMAGESSRRELEQLFNQAHKEYSDSLVAMDHTVPSVSDLLTQSTYFISRLPKKNVSASLIATTLFENTPFVKELQKSSLLTRMALRSHMLASYVLTCFVTHRPSLALFQFRPLNALPGSRTADQPPLPSQGGLSVRRELASCVAAVDEAAELLRVAFFNWSETAHRRLIVFVNLLRNTGDVLKQDGSALQPSTQLFVSGIAILTDALDFVAKAVSLVSATLLERISFNLEIVGRVTSVVHWIQALPHDMPPVLPAVRRMRRKSLFYLIFAGHTYNKLGLKDLSLRCFNLVLPYFSSASAPLPLVAQTCVELMTGKFTDSVGRRRVPLRVALAHDPRGMTQTTGCWRAILSHLRFTMARQAFASELNPASLVHFLELLNLAATSAHFGMLKDPNNRDQIHMKELLFVCKTLGLTVRRRLVYNTDSCATVGTHSDETDGRALGICVCAAGR